MAFTDEQLKGNWGEQYIASRLTSRGCFIRHVPEGHDTGVDLYCETTIDGDPFLHFWCQIKTSKKWSDLSKGSSLYPVPPEKLEYWKKQPIPVFIFLVPDLREETNVPFHIQTISRISFSDGSFIKPISTVDDLDNFLNFELVLQTWYWEAEGGKIGPFKSPKPDYVISFPTKVAHLFEDKASPTLFWTLSRLVQDILFQDGDSTKILNERSLESERKNQLLKKAKPYAKALEKLTIEMNSPHYEHYAILGGYYDLEENFDKAIEYYKRSKKSLDEDPTFKKLLGEDKWNNLYNEISSYIERIESQK